MPLPVATRLDWAWSPVTEQLTNACEGLGVEPQYKTKENKTDEQQPRP